jgi:biopolymer transport protein TolQ
MMTVLLPTCAILGEGSTSFWSLVSGSIRSSSAIENAILLLLVVCSVASWAIVLWKSRAIRAAKAGNAKFVLLFESAEDANEVAAAIPKLKPAPNMLIYMAALATVQGRKTTKRSAEASTSIPINAGRGLEERVQMKMEHAGRIEFSRLHRGMDILASIASSTPFIGLFGTVLGIMSTFQVLGSAKSASLNVVAPGIAAALIATAAGLAVAIPAVFAYNRLMARIDELQEQSDMFTESLSHWLLSAGIFQRLPSSHAQSHDATEPVMVGAGAHVPGATE